MVVGSKVTIIPPRGPVRRRRGGHLLGSNACGSRPWCSWPWPAAPPPSTSRSPPRTPRPRKRQGSVLVTFKALDPDVVVNEQPSPRLALDPAQKVLVDKQPPPAKTAPPDPEEGKYLDLSLPVAFPVALADGAAAGTQAIAGKVTYFYCSKREGWCRKGTSDARPVGEGALTATRPRGPRCPAGRRAGAGRG